MSVAGKGTASAAGSRSLEARLARIVEELTARLQAGEAADVEAYAAAHPEFASELRQLVPALAALANLSRSAGERPSGFSALAGEDEPTTGVLGDFRIVREVGRGGMGVVYEAEQISLGRRVALKVLPFAATMDPRHLQRFHNEARAAACLHHPHIVPVHAVGSERSVHYYAMQFIDGQTLAEMIRCQRHVTAPAERDPLTAGDHPPSSPVPPADTAPVAAVQTERAPRGSACFRQAAAWGIQAAEALEHAHSLGIVHRDIKPGNLMVDGQGRLWVADFGLMRTQTDLGLTLTGDVLGTLRYMSPEQALAKHGLVDHRTDVYSLGATLYELLTLQPAVAGRDREEILNRITLEDVPPLRQVNADIPRDLETIVLKALAKLPADRYASAQALAEDLRCYLADRPIRARRPTLLQHAVKWSSRHQEMVLMAAAGLLMASILLAASTWQIARSEREAIKQRDRAEAHAREVEQRERELRLQSYPTSISAAHRAWKAGNRPVARALLSGLVPEQGQEDLRGFEWYYLWERTRDDQGLILQGHKGRVYGVDYSPDGRTLVSAGQDGTVRLWDVNTGRAVAVLRGHKNEVNRARFTPDGRAIISQSDDGTARIWDVGQRELIREIRSDGGVVLGAAIGPDGKLAALVLRDRALEMWYPDTGGRVLLEGHVKGIRSGARSPDGRLLALGTHDGELLIWDIASGKLLSRRSMGTGVESLAFAPDGRLLVAHCTAALWAVAETQRPEFSFPVHCEIDTVAVSRDGTSLAYAGNSPKVGVWDARNLVLREFLTTTPARKRCAAFSPGGEFLALGDDEGFIRTHRVCPRPVGEPFRAKLQDEHRLSFSPDGRMLAITTFRPGVERGYQLLIIDRQTGSVRADLTAQLPNTWIGRTVFSPCGQVLVVECNGLRMWDTSTWGPPARVEGNGSSGPGFGGGDAPLMTYFSKTIMLFEIPGPKLVRRFPGPSTYVIALAYSPDGSLLAFVETPGLVRILESKDGRQVDEVLLPEGAVGHALTFSPVGDLLTIGDRREGLMYLWNVRERRLRHVSSSASFHLDASTFSPDGKTLAAAARDEVFLFHVATGQELFMLDRVPPYQGLWFSRDGQTLAGGVIPARSGAKDMWELLTWEGPRTPDVMLKSRGPQTSIPR